MSKRLWLYADLPIPADELGDLKHYRLLGVDPIELLRDVSPFIGDQASVPGLKERTDALLALFPVVGDRPEREPRGD